ncbi:helix-turn-helix domain-containing protein [Micromonospora chersina]|uniref:helix-turn-helix domain-containing protein n=1 Tax=Micromonospora chersina TaxID=47854 RepID=UPI003D8F5085
MAIAIAAHANHEGKAWPSVATIANYAGCSSERCNDASPSSCNSAAWPCPRLPGSPPASTAWSPEPGGREPPLG